LRECGLSCGRGVVGERREAAVVGRAELVERDDLCRLQDACANRVYRLDARVDRIRDAHEYTLRRPEERLDEIQHARTIALARQLNIEVADPQLEQARKELRVVDVRAVRRIAVATRTRVHAETPPLIVVEAVKYPIVERDEGAQQSEARVELHGQTPLREVDLHGRGAGVERLANVHFGLVG